MANKDSRRPGIISRMLRFLSELTYRIQRKPSPCDITCDWIRDPQASSRISKGGVAMAKDQHGEERGHDPVQEALRGSDYLAPGLYHWMLDQPPISECTISSIDELQEYERQEKEAYQHQYLEQKRRMKGFVPMANDLIQMHRHCKACPFHIQRCEMWKHPFRSALSIYRSWKHNRSFRRRMIGDMVNRDSPAVYLFLVSGLLLIVGAVLFRWLMTKGAKRFEAL